MNRPVGYLYLMIAYELGRGEYRLLKWTVVAIPILSNLIQFYQQALSSSSLIAKSTVLLPLYI